MIRVKPDGSGVDLANVKTAINPFGEIAVEEALRQKEAGKASEVVVVSIGPAQAAERLRTGQMLAALMNRGQGTFASKLILTGNIPYRTLQAEARRSLTSPRGTTAAMLTGGRTRNGDVGSHARSDQWRRF